MLVGTNKLAFNQATIMRIVEEYINKNFNPKGFKIKVTAFDYDRNDYVFKIETETELGKAE